jgi:tetratricopeptide (TPR) repeat protein
MNRAFLSHSSLDKPLVERVAQKLHSARVLIDRKNFQPGKRLADQIVECLEHSSLFVLFASKSSLASEWVQFEISEAERQAIANRLPSILVVLIDPEIKAEDLPEWMRETLATRQRRTPAIVRAILSRLIELSAVALRPLFFGRETDLSDIAEKVIPTDGSRPPQVLVFSGLLGVGRRTLAKRAITDQLFQQIGPTISLGEHLGADALYLRLVEENRDSINRSQLAKAVGKYVSMSHSERARATLAELETLAEENVVPLVTFSTAPLDEQGRFYPELRELFAAMGESPREPYIICVQSRRPAVGEREFGEARLAEFSVQPIDPSSSRKLLIQRLRMAKIAFNEDQVTRLLPFVEGYPPAIDFGVEYASRYGIDALVSSPNILVDLKVKRFGDLLLALVTDKDEQNVLRRVNLSTGLTLEAVSAIAQLELPAAIEKLNSLLDKSFLGLRDGRYIPIAPLRDSVYRAFGYVEAKEYALLASILKEEYWTVEGSVPPLEIVDLTILSAARGKESDLREFSDIVIPSQIAQIAISAYHSRDYALARGFAERILHTKDATDDLWSIYARALVRLATEENASWEEANRAVGETGNRRMRTYPYLRGFYLWKHGDFEGAVEWFGRALNTGDRRVAVFRDRANCLYHLGRYKEAFADIQAARPGDNKFILDLAAAIAIRSKNFKAADEILRDLERVEDKRENFLHRRAMYFAAKRQFELAIKDADEAARRQPPLHEILSSRVDILIELGRYPEAAKALDELEGQFRSKVLRNVRSGLRCKMALRQGDWRTAELLFEKITSPDLDVHQKLLFEILRQKTLDGSLSAKEQEKAKAQLLALSSKIDNIDEAFQRLVDLSLGADDASAQ